MTHPAFHARGEEGSQLSVVHNYVARVNRNGPSLCFIIGRAFAPAFSVRFVVFCFMVAKPVHSNDAGTGR